MATFTDEQLERAEKELTPEQLERVKTTLTPEQLERAEKAFYSRDADGDGVLTVEEFTCALKSYLSEKTLGRLLAKINLNGDETISYAEFLTDYMDDLSAGSDDPPE